MVEGLAKIIGSNKGLSAVIAKEVGESSKW